MRELTNFLPISENDISGFCALSLGRISFEKMRKEVDPRFGAFLSFLALVFFFVPEGGV